MLINTTVCVSVQNVSLYVIVITKPPLAPDWSVPALVMCKLHP